MLGEESLSALEPPPSTAPTTQTSVFEFISDKGKQRIHQALQSIGKEPALAGSAIPVITKDVAELALKGFQPFQLQNPEKSDRYTAFLEFYAGKRLSLPTWPPTMMEKDKQKEIEEFIKAAQIYQPLGGILGTKFRREGDSSVDHGLAGDNGIAGRDNRRDFKLIGRQTEHWVPTRLLCKRLGVPVPFPEEAKRIEQKERG